MLAPGELTPSRQVVEELLEQEAGWQLVALLQPIWMERKLVGRITIYAMFISLIIAFLIPSEYESTTRLMPPDNSSSAGLAVLSAIGGGAVGSAGGNSGGGLAAMASDFLGLKTSGALFVGILESRTIQDGIINRLDLRKVYSVRTYERARKILTKRTTLTDERKSGIVTITVLDRNPQRASAIARAYVDELNLVLAQSSTSSARRERIFLEERLKAVKQGLDESQKRFSEFASAKGVLDVKEQTKAMVEAASILEGQLIAAESEERGLEQIFTSGNVRVRSLQARIQELKSQLNRIGGIPNKGETRDATEEEDTLYPSIRQLPLVGVTWADLYREAKISEIVYETLTKQYELAKVQEAKEIPVARIFDQPNVPEKKASPHRFILTLVGTFLGVIFGAAYIVGKKSWGQRDAADPVKIFLTEVYKDTSVACRPLGAKLRRLPMPSRFRQSPTPQNDETNGDH
jgi:capsule polysaccharide export protein KpsE/RkpR